MLIIGADPLSVFLREAGAKTFERGAWDCGRYVAAWVGRRGHGEPGAEWVGRYSTPLGLARLLKKRGGIVAHFDQCLAAIGVTRTASPQRGDVALVSLSAEFGGEAGCDFLAGAIVLGGSTAVLSDRHGLMLRRLDVAPIAVAWRVV